MSARMRQITALVGVTALVVTMALLGGYSGPAGTPGGAGASESCSESEVLPGGAPAEQATSAVQDTWQQPEVAEVNTLADATAAAEVQVRSVGGSNGEPPVQSVELIVCEVLDGELSAGDVITLHKTGTRDSHVIGDPLYTAGERYVLFLKPDGDAWRTVGPIGRHLVLPDGTTEPVAPAAEGG